MRLAQLVAGEGGEDREADAKRVSVGPESQPQVSACISETSSAVRPAISTTRPVVSKRAGSPTSRLSTLRQPSRARPAPTATCMPKRARQLTASVSRPAITGPITKTVIQGQEERVDDPLGLRLAEAEVAGDRRLDHPEHGLAEVTGEEGKPTEPQRPAAEL